MPEGDGGGELGDLPEFVTSFHEILSKTINIQLRLVTCSIRSTNLAHLHHHCTRSQAMITPEEQYGQILALLTENKKGISELKEAMSEILKDPAVVH